MKKILIITDCTIGHRLIERTIKTYSKDNIYYVVQTRDIEYANAPVDRFKFFSFDPTSIYKLNNVLKMGFVQVMLIMNNKLDAINTLKNIRNEKPNLWVIMIDQWGLNLEDKNLLVIDLDDHISARLLDYMPNVPVVAQNIGLGDGEVMEVLVPFGSAYVYRHIGAVEQTQWRIAALYRDKKLIIPTPSTLIHPNDMLVLVGEPSVLMSIYKSIKRELGHFPAPYGISIYIYIDMKYDKADDLLSMVRKAILLQDQLNREVIIRITNPTDFNVLAEIKELRSDNVSINIDYHQRDMGELLKQDKASFNVGMAIVTRKLFSYERVRRALYELELPVLKIARAKLRSIKRAVVVLSESKDIEKITTTVFDISSQLGWRVELLEYKQQHNKYREEIEQYYDNLAPIFSQTVNIVESEGNPLMELRSQQDFIQCLPFSKSTLKRDTFAYLSTDAQKLFFHLDSSHQLFIPV